MARLSGGCLCGAIRYEIPDDCNWHYLCHCGDCRRHGGGAWHAGIMVPAEDLALTGVPHVWTKTADSGTPIGRHFCGTCGTHLFASRWPDPVRVSVKPGTLDDPEAFDPKLEIWTRSRVGWAAPRVDLEGHERGFAGTLGPLRGSVRN